MKLKLGFSTCPNDTFIFDALVHQRIDNKGYEFELTLADVEELNQAAFDNELDITKISFHAYAYLWKYYQILDSGSALGSNNGPLLISKRKIYPDEVNYLNIAIPGRLTTANLLLQTAYPNLENTTEYLFSDIEEAVLSNEVDAGLIIHESRLTYQQKGLQKIIDLGEFWEQKSKTPIPLGGIIINRKIESKIKKDIEQLIYDSIKFAYQNPDAPLSFMKQHAQEIDDDIIKQHIELYVNEYTLKLGDTGKKAIVNLYKRAFENKIIKEIPENIFV